jgi:hypothetical protein
LDLASFLHIVDGAKRASDGADFATDASCFVHHFGTGSFIHRDGFYGASVQAPGFVALGTGVGNLFARVMKVEYLDARFGRGKCAVVLERTGHFALQTASALVCVDVQHLLHVYLLWVM